jgi:glycogen synthase
MKLNVLMLGWEFPPYNSGGLGVACKHLCEALHEYGVRMAFLLPWKVDAQSGVLEFIFADESTQIPDYKPFMSGYVTEEEFAKLSEEERFVVENDLAMKVLSYAKRASRIVEGRSFDIFHAHDWLTFKAGLYARGVGHSPLIAHVHSTEFDRSGGHSHGNPFCRMVEYEMMHNADGIIAVSNYTTELTYQSTSR